MKKLIQGVSNWQLIALMIINKVKVGNNRRMSRTEIFSSENLYFAVRFTELLGHKNKPKHPEETLQRTLQNLRDKGYIDFLGDGEYRLTEKGVEAANVIGEKYPYDALNDALKSNSTI